MKTVVILSLLVLGLASISTHGAEPVKVGGDFGTAWLKNLPIRNDSALKVMKEAFGVGVAHLDG
jgi:hypothetical protein